MGNVLVEEQYLKDIAVSIRMRTKLIRNNSIALDGKLNTACYANGQFVIIGYSRTNSAYEEYVSNDYITWTKVSTYPKSQVHRMAFGGGKYVALGPNVAMYSTNAKNWSNASLTGISTFSTNSVCYSNNLFVSVSGTSPSYATWSSNGETWNIGNGAPNSSWQSVCYGNGKFVAVGAETSNQVMVSTDGKNWSVVSPGFNRKLYGVCYGNGKFVAVGEYVVAYSTNGITWKTTSNVTSAIFKAVAYGNGMFLAVRPLEYVMSSDGDTWITRESKNSDTYPGNIAYFEEDRFIAIGDYTPYTFTLDASLCAPVDMAATIEAL